MKPIAALLALGLLTGCAAGGRHETKAVSEHSADIVPISAASEPVCRIGRDDGPSVADRGIGGTGTPLWPAAQRVAERGIGGTGIIGVITGFASICVNGLDVHYDASAAVDVDGEPASVSALRAGQVVIIHTRDSAPVTQASSISIRREVVGRVDAVSPANATLVVAGQPVTVPNSARGGIPVRVGDWIAVSGLRRPDGMIVASRLDHASPDRFLIRGRIARADGTVRIGQQSLQGPATDALADSQLVTASGRYVDGRAELIAVADDVMLQDPSAYFTPPVSRLVVQAYVRVAGNAVSFDGLTVPANPALPDVDPDGIAVISLRRAADGSLVVTGLRAPDEYASSDRTSARQPASPVNSPASRSVSPPRGDQPTATASDSQANLNQPPPAAGAHPPDPADASPVRQLPQVAAPATPCPPGANVRATPVAAPVDPAPALIPAAPRIDAPATSGRIATPGVAAPVESPTSDLISQTSSSAGAQLVAATSGPPKSARLMRLARSMSRLRAGGSAPPTISLAAGAATPDAPSGTAPAASASCAHISVAPPAATLPTPPPANDKRSTGP